MLPKVVFKYSWIYDQTWKEGLIGKKIKKYPSSEKLLGYIKKIEKLWRKDERKILREVAKITHLKWQSEFIGCYVVGRCRPFSFPLTMPIYEKHPDRFIDVLTHELIHNILTENLKKTKKAQKYIDKKYRKESIKTKNHIFLHAFHAYIYDKFFDEKRLKQEIKFINSNPDYKKSWQIVQKEGYQSLINEFVKRIK